MAVNLFLISTLLRIESGLDEDFLFGAHFVKNESYFYEISYVFMKK